jgi:GT2 family glycosyltransferase
VAEAGSGAERRTGALLLNWRQSALTRQCLEDLVAARTAGLRVLLLDNGSGDGSADELRAAAAAASAAGLPCELLALEGNLGFTGGMNRGFEWAAAAGCEFVLVLNNDLRLPPGFLQPMLDVLVNDARVAAVMPTVVRPDGRVWAQGGSLGFCANALRLCGHGGAPAPTTHGPEAIDFAPGACVLFRARELQAVAGFDDAYFMYWEDVELCRRLRARGSRIVWLPWVRVAHLGGASAGGSRSPLRKYLMAKNGVRYLRRHGGVRHWAALLLIDVPSLPLLALRSPRAAWAKLCGLAAGFAGRPSTAADVQRWRR